MTPIQAGKRTASIFFILLIAAGIVFAQRLAIDDSKKLDKFILAGFDAIKESKWAEAEKQFSAALEYNVKNPGASKYLYDNLILPDEDKETPPKSKDEVLITAFRHGMGTTHSLKQLRIYTSALRGDSMATEKYFNELTGFRSYVWGLSWRVFTISVNELMQERVRNGNTPEYARFLFISGELLLEADDDRWLSFTEKANRIDPKNTKIASTLADRYLMRDRYREAKVLAEMSLSIDPEQPPALITLANSDWMLGDIDSAERHIDKVAKLRPDLPGVNALKALLFIEKGKLKEALEQARIGSLNSSRHPVYQTVLAAALAANGDVREAKAILDKAWPDQHPSKKDLEHWFFVRKPLELILELYTDPREN